MLATEGDILAAEQSHHLLSWTAFLAGVLRPMRGPVALVAFFVVVMVLVESSGRDACGFTEKGPEWTGRW